MPREKDIEIAIEECRRFSIYAERHLDDEAATPEDTADVRRYALDAIRALRRVREDASEPVTSE